MQGQRYFSPEVMEQLAQVEERGTADCDLLTALTDREVDVLRQLIIEKSQPDVAQTQKSCHRYDDEHGGILPRPVAVFIG